VIRHRNTEEEEAVKITRYVEALLCPTLSDIRIAWDFDVLWINPVQATRLLVEMARICPNLNKLRIHVEESQYRDDLRSLGPYSPVNPLIPIPQFLNLRVLSTNSMVLDLDVLQLLGCLPRLECLKVYSGVDYDNVSIAGPELPPRSFPSLRHLEMNQVIGTVLSTLWRIAPLVQNLVSVAVNFCDASNESINRLICTICQGSLLLTDFKLNFGHVSDYVNLAITTIDHFRQLPLEHVRILSGYADCQHLASVLPNVECLWIDALIVRHQDLVLIPKYMPKLRYLAVRLDLEDWPFSLPRHCSSPVSCHIDSHFLFKREAGLDLDGYIALVARYVFILL
jgi:hypothetical protein